MKAHYRAFQDFDWKYLDQAKQERHNLQKKIWRHLGSLRERLASFDTTVSYSVLKQILVSLPAKQFLQQLVMPLFDDLNMPNVLAQIHTHIDSLDEEGLLVLYWLEQQLLKIGLFAFSADDFIIPQNIQDLAQQRRDAKQAKDYAKSDELRDAISILGYEVLDTKD